MNILIVEDDENKRVQLLGFLKTIIPQISVIERRSYQSGLKEIVGGRFDVVLLDMTMPTYDKSPVESGGRLRPFAGKEILAQMFRRNVDTPVIVVTQFETFGEGAATMSLAELKEQMKRAYPKLYRGAVYYSAAQSQWKDDLYNYLAEIGDIGSKP